MRYIQFLEIPDYCLQSYTRHKTNHHLCRLIHQCDEWSQKVMLMLLCPQCQPQVSEDADHALVSQNLTIIHIPR